MQRPCLTGTSLVEVLLVMGIMVILLAIIGPLGADTLRNYYLQSDRDSLVSLLEQARDQAMANVDASPHGVAITTNAYVEFTGTSYTTRTIAKDYTYPRTSGITVTGPTSLVFQPLTGQTTATSFTVDNSSKHMTISVNSEGMVDWSEAVADE